MENEYKGKVVKLFTITKYIVKYFKKFQVIFLKHYLSDRRQYEILIKCSEAPIQSIYKDFQEHFHFWIVELRELDPFSISEEQAINLVLNISQKLSRPTCRRCKKENIY